MTRPTPEHGCAPPPYAVSLRDVLPALIRSLGVAPAAGDEPWPVPVLELPPARTAVVVLIDGLGARQLARRSGHAPYLRSLTPLAPEVRSGFPSTTAVSLASLGTGRLPGEHGLVGWQVRLPGTDRLLNHLSWAGGPHPTTYQPGPTLLERAAQAGVQVSTVAQPEFQGSGLTRAALRGGRFVPARTLDERVRATVRESARARQHPQPALIYLYVGEVDRAGHEHGPDSLAWGAAVEEVDAALAALARALSPGTSLTLTADHGMVEAPEALRRDLAHDSGLDDGVALLGGEPRVPYAYCRPGAAEDVLQRWRALLGEHAAHVLSRTELIETGWLGPVREEVAGRIGDVVAVLDGGATVLDSRLLRPQVVALRGHHGSLSDEETLIPLLHDPA
ncbi:MAG: alkaline phosphatase family protein [Ornithinimicrobium sp.]|uniref:alkaline phosphatase family protein n=1 Tax=Ornithinimicrobium sp. TaxID=1977084 RepID=UPI003D9AC328